MITISNNADAISTVATGRADAYAATGQTASDLASKGGGKVELAAEFKDPIIDGNPVRSWGGFAFAKESEDLRDAVKDYQRFTAHEAKRRQLQYIGKLMRNVDPEPIRFLDDAGLAAAAAGIPRFDLDEGVPAGFESAIVPIVCH